MKVSVILPPRGVDKYGSGAFKAPRGSRTHNGEDYESPVGAVALSVVFGKVTKLGYVYADDLSYRYVEVTTQGEDKLRWRMLYVAPSVTVGEYVTKGQAIGVVQDLNTRYPGITPHVHLEIKTLGGTYLDPKDFA